MAQSIQIDVRWNAEAGHWYVASASGLQMSLTLSAATIPELQSLLSKRLPAEVQERAVLTVTDTRVGGGGSGGIGAH